MAPPAEAPRRRLSPTAYRRITGLALVALTVIVVTGGAVRLSGSGLGCSDWPTCEQNRLVAPAELHAMIEFVNRMFTGLVSVAVMAAVLGSLWRAPRRRDLTWLSLGLVAGVIGQILLGALVVLSDLSPWLVGQHFVLSMVLVANAVVLYHRAGQPDGASHPVVDGRTTKLGRLLLVLTAVVIFAGTVVTGSGPHGGDERVERLPFSVHDVTRIHGALVAVLLGTVLTTGWYLRRSAAPASVIARLEWVLGVLFVQGAIGYVQYFTGVPAVLVGLHIAGATLLWIAVWQFNLGLRAPDEEAAPVSAPADDLVVAAP
jgi:cytochrome c oxidase assembly protein subunit 15